MSHRVSDLTKLPEEILVDLINHDNPATLTALPLTTAKVGFKDPVPTPPESARNTEVVVYAKRKSGYKGEVRVSYNRLDIADVAGDEELLFELGDAQTLSDLIPAVNTRFGVNLTTKDFIDTVLKSTTNGWGNKYLLEFRMAPESLVYIGDLTFTIRTNDPDGILLSVVITDRVLDIFRYTPPN